MERGVAAMRATLAILTEPRTQANNYPTANIDPSSGRPFVAHGLEPENVDHEGIPQLPARSGPDCKPSANCPAPLHDDESMVGPGGEVGGLAAIAFARHRFGGAFMDAARGLCVGIDGVSLEGCAVGPAQSVSAAMRNLMGPALLERPWDSVRPT